MPIWGIVLLVLLAVILLLAGFIIIWVINVYNALVRLRNQAEEGYSTMDVYMKKRYDLIPNFVETVKGYAKHEQETLTKVIEARNLASNSATPKEKVQNEGAFTEALKSLLVVVEKYPELKADRNFNELQNKLSELENEIASSRKYYNGCVKNFNNKIEMFPSNLVARKFKFEKKVLFEIENKEEKKAPKVEF